MTVRDFMNAKTLYYKNNKECIPNGDEIIDRIEILGDNILVHLIENVSDMTLNELHERCTGVCLDCSLIKQCPFTSYVRYLKPYKWRV